MFRTFTLRTFPLLALLCLGLVPLSAQAQSVSQKPVLTTLHRFDNTHGAIAVTTLTLGSDGNFYGVTEGGGLNGGTVFNTDNGIVFQMTPQGKFTTLWRFNGRNGGNVQGQLVEGKDGAFYGTTVYGGPGNGNGTIFRITKEGRLTTLHVFTQSGAQEPVAGLTPAPDGSWYGVTYYGSSNDNGTVFHMTAAGVVTTLHTFIAAAGAFPAGALVFGPDGALYGTTQGGGKTYQGTVFRITTAGAFSVLHSFATGSDGSSPAAGLTLASDGAFYGTTLQGGAHDGGTLFRITPAGQFTVLHKFSYDGDGFLPVAALTLGPDGNLYGTTARGGTTTKPAPNGAGTVFVMTPAGQVTTLYKFHTAFDGFYPFGGVAFGPNGLLYGTTSAGGAKGYGTLFSLSVPTVN